MTAPVFSLLSKFDGLSLVNGKMIEHAEYSNMTQLHFVIKLRWSLIEVGKLIKYMEYQSLTKPIEKHMIKPQYAIMLCVPVFCYVIH